MNDGVWVSWVIELESLGRSGKFTDGAENENICGKELFSNRAFACDLAEPVFWFGNLTHE